MLSRQTKCEIVRETVSFGNTPKEKKDRQYLSLCWSKLPSNLQAVRLLQVYLREDAWSLHYWERRL